jgi:biopolymer transport protein ExbB
VLEIIKAAGWPIYPLILASVVAIAIIVERAWTLRSEVIAPSNLLP